MSEYFGGALESKSSDTENNILVFLFKHGDIFPPPAPLFNLRLD